MTFLVGSDLAQQPAGERFRALLSEEAWEERRRLRASQFVLIRNNSPQLNERWRCDPRKGGCGGTHDYYTGKPPFPNSVACAKARGYDITHLIARRIRSNDFDHFDLILGMDKSNVASLKSICPTRCKEKIELLLDYGDKFNGNDRPRWTRTIP